MTNHTFKTGESRDQVSLLPARIEDYVGADNPVRAIESFVCALDLAKLGFRHADRGAEEAGQPPYDPADLLKLYLYGYINQVRSSRRLEREASRNLELIWLLKNLKPGYRTIANFRKENWAALKAANRSFVLLARELELVGGSVVVNDSSDVGQLHAMAKAAKDILGAKALQVLADEGYYSSLELKACEDDGIVAYVPVPEGNKVVEKKGRFSRRAFSYDAGADAYHCPAGERLRRVKGHWQNASGRIEIRYASRKAICQTCRLRSRCLAENASQRIVYRWEHEDVLERHRARMQGADELMRRRSALIEHPFGTIKCRAGYRHFLVRGFNKVRGEWSLMALCYNLSRVLNILGLERFIACIANLISPPLRAPTALLNLICTALSPFWTPNSPPLARCRQALPFAH
ncbi:transposase [Bradyrhizobium sp.]|uniref:transposase n=1 Tax=Bradyrhizobium sp. TaxID=376 RepID=UPI0039C85542